MWSVPSRRSEASQALCTYSGRPLIERSPFSPRTIANFVAMTTSSRRPASASRSSSSLWPLPYMSAVSKSVTPSSIARWIVAIDSSRSASP